MENIQFTVFETDKRYGQMNDREECHPEGMSAEERRAVANKNKAVIARELGFDLKRLFMGLQGQERGTCYTLTREDVANYQDLYLLDKDADMVKMTAETAKDKTAIGFNVSDGANVIAMNLDTMQAVSTFCSGAHINAMVPLHIAEALGGNPRDIVVDVSHYAYVIPFFKEGDPTWSPAWIDNKDVWKDCTRRTRDGMLYINQQFALKKQLLESGILDSNIHERGDSFFEKNYYSSQRARIYKNPSDNGRFMHGVFYDVEGTKYNNTNCKVRVYKKK